MTDQWAAYKALDKEFADHQTVAHDQDEYVRGDVHTNTVEGYFATLKRGINGTYHHVSRAHLPSYLSEFDFRYNTRFQTDSARTIAALEGSEGKRLKYRDSS